MIKPWQRQGVPTQTYALIFLVHALVDMIAKIKHRKNTDIPYLMLAVLLSNAQNSAVSCSNSCPMVIPSTLVQCPMLNVFINFLA